MKNLSALLILTILTSCSTYEGQFSKEQSRSIASEIGLAKLSEAEKKMMAFLDFNEKALVYKGKGFRRNVDGEEKMPVDCWVFVGHEEVTKSAIKRKRQIIRIDYSFAPGSTHTVARYLWSRGLSESVKGFSKDDTFVLTGESVQPDKAYKTASTGLFMKKENGQLISIDFRDSNLSTLLISRKLLACENLEQIDFDSYRSSVRDRDLME